MFICWISIVIDECCGFVVAVDQFRDVYSRLRVGKNSRDRRESNSNAEWASPKVMEVMEMEY